MGLFCRCDKWNSTKELIYGFEKQAKPYLLGILRYNGHFSFKSNVVHFH